ncbi:conserved hypothetical protein [metagenome]|uniref:Isoprenylcysteine carboxyl methyltransferase n=1 Tax=metagenome TaxID=256318 RepID=A0A2P2CCJ6_9ZZZZ
MVRVPPPVIALAAVLGQRALTGPTGRPPAARAVLATTLVALSGSLAGAASRQFARRGTTIDPIHPDQASVLVTTGPNAITRNPMYVGLAGVVVAHAVWRGSWMALLPVAGYLALIDRLQIPAEENALVGRFGPDYEAYRETTPRWLDRRSLEAVRG